MAIGAPLPGGDHIVRGCSKGHDNGEVTASAFELRERDRSFLRISVDWVECPYVDLIDQTPKGSVKRSKRKMVRGPYAVLSVLDIREAKLKDRVLDVLEVGDQSGTGTWKKSHSGLLRVNEDLSFTQDVSWADEGGVMETVFLNSELKREQTTAEIRGIVKGGGNPYVA